MQAVGSLAHSNYDFRWLHVQVKITESGSATPKFSFPLNKSRQSDAIEEDGAQIYHLWCYQPTTLSSPCNVKDNCWSACWKPAAMFHIMKGTARQELSLLPGGGKKTCNALWWQHWQARLFLIRDLTFSWRRKFKSWMVIYDTITRRQKPKDHKRLKIINIYTVRETCKSVNAQNDLKLFLNSGLRCS